MVSGVVSVTGVVFILIGLGYLCVRLRLFSDADMAVLGKYVVNLAMPALVFRAMTGRDIGDVIDIGYLLAYLIASLAVFALIYWSSRTFMSMSPAASTFQAMGASCANSGFVGYPILLIALPPVATTALALNMIVETLVMIPLTLIMAERAQGGHGSGLRMMTRIGARLLRNPIVLALIAGLAASLLRWQVPPLIARPIELLAQSSAAIALIVIGGTLAGLKLRSMDGRVLPVILGKLILHPLAAALALMAGAAMGLGPGDPRLADAGIILAAMPAMTIYPLLAQRYGQQAIASLAMLAMTILSFFTISALLALLNVTPGA